MDVGTLPPITVKPGETFQIADQDNSGSTGYICSLKAMPDCVALLSDDYLHNPGVGVPGTRRFTFLATKEGEGPIDLLKVRPWDFQNPAPQTPMEHRFVKVAN